MTVACKEDPNHERIGVDAEPAEPNPSPPAGASRGRGGAFAGAGLRHGDRRGIRGCVTNRAWLADAAVPSRSDEARSRGLPARAMHRDGRDAATRGPPSR